MAKNNRVIEDIDEAAMLQSIYERDNGISNIQPKVQEKPVAEAKPVVSPETEQSEQQPKEETRTKRARQQEYESLFIHEPDLPPARFGKSVYIRKEYHDRISQIISVIGLNEVSLFGYIDNVLTQHFENFGEDITQSFKKNIIFK
ncbi:MAG: DUF3408 domain-containing protein [Tannerella sp.]|jgi:hypothetical protein|nr:DUF3408 domain-containing protein [Tannerella sp.]